MIRRPPRSTRTDTLFPYTTLFRSCTEVSGTRQRNLHLRKTMPVEMAAQGRQELFGIDADDEADLAMRRRLARDRVDRRLRIAGLEGQHVETAPAVDALGRAEPRLAPPGIDGRTGITAAAPEIGRAHV